MVDVAIIVIVVVFALIGFLRGTWSSLFKLIISILCIPLAMLIGNLTYEKISGVNLTQLPLIGGIIPFENIDGIGAWLRGLNATVNDILTATPSLEVLITNWAEVFAKVLMIYIVGIMLFFAMAAVSTILWHLLIKHIFPKKKIRIGGAAISMVQAIVIVGFVLMPVIIARPLVKNLQESEITTAEMNNTITTGTDYIDGSFTIKLIGDMSSPFTKNIGNYTHEDKTYNVFAEFNEAIDLLDIGMKLKDTLETDSAFLDINFENSNPDELRTALNKIGDVLSGIDADLNALLLTSNIRNITEEMVVYFLTTILSETGAYSDANLSGLDFSEEFNIKDQVMQILKDFAISHFQTQYPFLEGYDLSALTFDEIVDLVVAFSAGGSIFDMFTQIQNDPNNINNYNPELVSSLFANLNNSELAIDMLEDLMEELTGETSLDFSGADLLSEGELMALLTTLSQTPNPSEEDCIILAIGVAHSVTTYQFVLLTTSPTKHLVTVNATIYANIILALDADGVDPVRAANVMNIYQIG